MFDSIALDVVIGLVFIYLLYSLFATILQELLATVLGIRARMLKLAISRMLNDDYAKKNTFLHFVESSARTILTVTLNYKGTLAQKFYDQPSIKYLGDQSWHSKPAYINAENFSKTLIDILRGDKFKPGENAALKINESLFTDASTIGLMPDTKLHLQSLMADANGDIDKFKMMLEKWFDDTMERATGWYKRKVQFLLLVIGFFLAGIFNVDTIAIVQKLSTDKDARAALVKMATSNYKSFAVDSSDIKSLDSTLLSNLKSSMTKSNNILSSGFVPDTRDSIISNSIQVIRVRNDEKTGLVYYEATLDSAKFYKAYNQKAVRAYTETTIWGWLITALAISLGAPFWYDLLSKLVKIKGAGPTPEKSNQSGSGSQKDDKSLKAVG